MEIKIDLDMNQIDYDVINKQIQEKIATLDIKDMCDVNAKIDNKISNYIENEIVYHYNRYLARYFGESTSSEGRNLIENMTKEEIKKQTQKVIDDIFENDYNEEKLRELMFKILPDVFATLLFEKMNSALLSKEINYYDDMYNRTRGLIRAEFRETRY